MPHNEYIEQRPQAGDGSVVDEFGRAARWQDRALCAGVGPAVFFPDSIHDGHHAKRICQRCEVRDECLNYALTNNERFGIWGGLSSRQRQRLQTASPDTHRGGRAAGEAAPGDVAQTGTEDEAPAVVASKASDNSVSPVIRAESLHA